MKKCILTVCILSFAYGISYSQPGSLDNIFGTGGKVITDIGGTDDVGQAVAVQTDGKIVVGGYTYIGGINYDFVVVRYNTDGTLDNTFGTGGKVVTDFFGNEDRCYALGIQNDGKIVAAGVCHNGSTPHFALARYSSNGTLDNSFDSDGKVITDFGNMGDQIASIAFQSDGKIIAGGSNVVDTAQSDFALARYNTDGSLDNSFDADGMATIDFGTTDDYGYSLAIQSDGKIVITGTSANASGTDFTTARFNSNGSPDNTFGTAGKVITDVGSMYDASHAVAIQNDGKIICAGVMYTTDYVFTLVRYNSDGSMDTGFDGDGVAVAGIENNNICQAVMLQPDGKIIAAGITKSGFNIDFALVRFNTDGSLDNTFNTDGKVITDFGSNDDECYSMAMQPDGKIILVGGSSVSGDDFAMARYDNSVTTAIETAGSEKWTDAIYPNPSSGVYTISIKNKTAETTLCVRDVLGSCILNNVNLVNNQQEIDLTGQPKGIYFVEITSANEKVMKKIVLQ